MEGCRIKKDGERLQKRNFKKILRKMSKFEGNLNKEIE